MVVLESTIRFDTRYAQIAVFPASFLPPSCPLPGHVKIPSPTHFLILFNRQSDTIDRHARDAMRCGEDEPNVRLCLDGELPAYSTLLPGPREDYHTIRYDLMIRSAGGRLLTVL